MSHPNFDPPIAATSPRRSASVWITLLIVWAIGLVFWAGYFLALIYLFFKLFG